MPLSLIGGVTLERPVSDIERKLRIELAAAFRIAQHLDWNIDTLNHITLRIPDTDTFLMNPLGLAWEEVTASSLATVDFDGKIISHSGVRLAPAGFNFHSGILKARPDLNCVMHTHESAGVVMGSTDQPLIAISQGGCRLHDDIGYHDFEGLANQSDEVPRILRDLGPKHTLIMYNHGLLSVGASVGEAFGWMRTLIDECRLVERAIATGRKIREIPVEVQKHTKAQMGGNNRGNSPRDDHSWQYWLRLADRLDPAFAS
ncbi:MAG TPA: class II aldolase/adducin family protein [Xanthobacteraceae bacterium]|jgi:ribulose-5-phosphate 4-epimerase/fuculose-1-phosphate aldolase|nr:class II aldolase/adducin family protein [Xanthobacteraceae bacterium]